MDETTSNNYHYDDKFFSYWQSAIISRLLSAKVWKSVKDGYIPPKRVKSPAQKEAKRNNALALESIQKYLSKAMRNKMETITSAKESWLSLEQTFKKDERGLVNMILEDKTNDIKREVKGYITFSQLLIWLGIFDSEEPNNTGMSDSEEPNNTGKYIGNISKPPVDFIEKYCSKVERCFHSHYNSESENEKSTCYSDHTSSDFEDDECDRKFRYEFHQKNVLAKECDSSNKNDLSVEDRDSESNNDSEPEKLMFMAMNSTSAPESISEDEVDVSEQLNNALEELGSVKLKYKVLKEANKGLVREKQSFEETISKLELRLEVSRSDEDSLLKQLQQREQVIERLQAKIISVHQLNEATQQLHEMISSQRSPSDKIGLGYKKHQENTNSSS